LPVSGSRDARVAAIASAQRGRVERSQLIEAGLTRHMIEGMVGAGRMRREHRGIYRVGHAAAIPLGRETAALLACGEKAVLSRGTAASLWGLRRPTDDGDAVEVTVIGGQVSRSRAGIRVHRSRLITYHDVRVKGGLPVTSPAWTLIDLAAGSTSREAERALDEALARRLVSMTSLVELLARTAGHKGHGPLSALVARRSSSTVTRSEAEERMLALIRAAQLPPPQQNAWVCGYGVDFHWPAERLVVEVDGYAWHSSPSAFERDRRKGNVLTSAGIDLVRVTWMQMDRDPLALMAGLARRIAQRTPDQ
jgi:very-short-patch-repair endonuclease